MISVAPGSLLLVHTSFKAVGQGSPEELIASLRAALGPEGTLVMPAMSDDDDQIFDPRTTPCRGMGTIANVPYRVKKFCTTSSGRVEYQENDHCCRRFALVDEWLGDRQTRGQVGNAGARLARSADIVRVAVEKLRQDPLIFLDDCQECAEARATISA